MCSCFTCYYTCHRVWMISSLGPIFGLRHKVVHQDRDHFGTAHTSVAVQVTCCCVVLWLTSLKNFADKFHIRRVFIPWKNRKTGFKLVLNRYIQALSIYHFCARAIAANDVMYQHPVTSNWSIAGIVHVSNNYKPFNPRILYQVNLI